MKTEVKRKVIGIFIGVVMLHVVLIGCISLSGGCSSSGSKILEERQYVPPPEIGPGKESATTPPPVLPATPAPAITDTLPPPPPPPPPAAPSHSKKGGAASGVSGGTYVVEKNDSFWKIAHKLGVSANELADLNNMSINKPLQVGAKLKVPAGAKGEGSKAKSHEKGGAGVKTSAPKSKTDDAGAAAALGKDGSYVVQSGDNLWTVAKKFKVKGSDLAAANKIDANKPLQIGQKIIIPGASGKASAGAPEKATAATTKHAGAAAGAGSVKETKKPAATTATVAAPSPVVATAPGTASKPAAEKKAEPTALGPVADEAMPDVSNAMTHTVTEPITVKTLADMYGVKAEDILKINQGLPAAGEIKVNTVVKIPEQ